MKKTRLLSMFIAVMMVLLITSSAMAETIVIGGAGPLTGGAAQYGISVEQGAQLYIDQINAELAASGSDTRFELIFEDNGGDDTISAVTAMGYDAYYVALEALKAAGSTDPAAVKAALPGVTYTGVTGDIAFDDIGDAIRDTAYIKVADTANNAWALETMQKAG